MLLSLTERAVLPFARAMHVDDQAQRFGAARASIASSTLGRKHRHAAASRSAVHAVLADVQGAWAWSPDDPHAAATRHASARSWIEEHPGSQMRLWVSGTLVRSLERGNGGACADDVALRSHARRAFVERHGEDAGHWALATWRSHAALGVCALAGVDLGALAKHAHHHDVKLQTVAPWWYHAFQEARRCVHALSHAEHGLVCVVEGRQLAWIATARGMLAEVWQSTLEAPCVDALRAEIDRTIAGDKTARPVVLGQGLADGARSSALNAWVLGRLDGDQPPQWLRPTLRSEMH